MANSKFRKPAKNIGINNIPKKDKTFSIILLFALFILILVLILSLSMVGERLKENTDSSKIKYSEMPSFVSLNNITFVSMKVPAVDSSGKGVSSYLAVESMPGTGRTLVDIDNLLFWEDTQQSMRISRLVAANITKSDVNNYDLVYSIYANASTVGGPSAGAALTLATIAALEKRKINESVMITGSINHDGTIGPVGSILEKAKAAKDVNATLFLVPLLQSRDVIYENTEHCEKFGHSQVCTTETIPRKIDVSGEAGIQVIEIGTIKEAMQYILI